MSISPQKNFEHESRQHLGRFILNTFRNEDYAALVFMAKGKLRNFLGGWSRDELSSCPLILIRSEPF